jgi:NAD(P)-dependent dehydrogenase (short-subunit alcohol dehydrogenase family)
MFATSRQQPSISAEGRIVRETSSIIIVTGAAGNVGRALLTVLAGRGDRIIAVDHIGTALEEALAPFGGSERHLVLSSLDLFDPSACQSAVQAGLARYGRIDGVAHTVGGFAAASASEGGPELWENMYRLNVLTTLNMFQAALVPMRTAGRGSLVAVGAGAAIKAPSGLAAYAGAKSAVHRLVESFADELKSACVRVNAILPSIIDTPQNRMAMPDSDHAAWVSPREIADAIAFLLTDDASGITGAFIPVTGRV